MIDRYPPCLLRLALSALTVSTLLSSTIAQHLADYNSLRAFSSATAASELSLLSIDQTPLNLTLDEALEQDTYTSRNSAWPFSSAPPTSSLSSTVPMSSDVEPASTSRSNGETSNSDPEALSNEHLSPLLQKRQNACGNYRSCSTLGAPSLCCPKSALCSADSLGNVGCCPTGYACAGTIPTTNGVVATAAAATTTTQTAYTTAVITTTTEAADTATSGGGFVLAGSSTVAILGTSGAGRGPRVVSRLLSASSWHG